MSACKIDIKESLQSDGMTVVEDLAIRSGFGKQESEELTIFTIPGETVLERNMRINLFMPQLAQAIQKTYGSQMQYSASTAADAAYIVVHFVPSSLLIQANTRDEENNPLVDKTEFETVSSRNEIEGTTVVIHEGRMYQFFDTADENTPEVIYYKSAEETEELLIDKVPPEVLAEYKKSKAKPLTAEQAATDTGGAESASVYIIEQKAEIERRRKEALTEQSDEEWDNQIGWYINDNLDGTKGFTGHIEKEESKSFKTKEELFEYINNKFDAELAKLEQLFENNSSSSKTEPVENNSLSSYDFDEFMKKYNVILFDTNTNKPC